MKKTSIIIRTKNEERWIKTCLDSLMRQSNQNFEIIIVDNNSDDNTIEIVKRHPIFKKIKILNIFKYIPGQSLNIGIKSSRGEIIVCISAHCIPSNDNWLNDLIKPLDLKKRIVATYGRQVPMPYSNPEDVRDMILVFSKDERLQKNDYFFHNAHSAFYKKIWAQFPFNENLTNIEDRDFGKNIIDSNYLIYYNPIPTVYHYHGIHQTGNQKRLEGVIKIMKSLDKDDELLSLPDVCSISNQSTIIFIPLLFKELDEKQTNKLTKIISKFSKIKSVKSIIFITYKSIHFHFKDFPIVQAYDRESIDDHLKLGVFELIGQVYMNLENKLDYDLGVYFNFYYELNENNFKALNNRLDNFPSTGVDVLFPGIKDYGYYWYFENNKFHPTSFEKSVFLKEKRNHLYKAFYGLGTVFNLFSLKAGNILNGNILIDEIK